MEIKTIIESLRHCTISEGDSGPGCRSCPSYHHDSGCLDRLHVKAAAALESQQKRIAELETQNRWIPVTEPPKERGCYIVTVQHWVDGKPVSREAYWNGADWLSCDKRHELTPRVTHWMPLPVPPKGE